MLRSALDRIRTARPELADRLDLSGVRALRALRAGFHHADAVDTEVLAVVVVGRLDLPRWVRETCAFALTLGLEARAAWRGSFTRTVYLAGSPANLRERFAFDHVAGDGSVAWCGPAPSAATATLRRLLKAFEAGHELTAVPAATVTVPRTVTASGAGRPRPAVHRDLHIVTTGVTVAHALVHVNHLLAEAVLDGLIRPGDHLTLRFVPRLTGPAGRFAMLRVDTDVHRPDELRAYAGLTTET
ncbi:hypothetical protein HGA06_04205 [Streptomyces somaliensis DSM 40738]|uniref:Uncharacterized protein n=1 Tax=Streptomyces somaliensis (strain ATCC 33201 / DSM 40738 / JCM 12659 / KCTC 9044 / NCTC 11332 / NRRL B-12077 / IP 733) TaxID=1134445 RepID=A0AA44DB49_STRE0|nr:DUF6182 family protein [Streptomyces somaliensis]NKY13399.1 hypothetical protein [Streptomyces somaliensis DSM 40738]